MCEEDNLSLFIIPLEHIILQTLKNRNVSLSYNISHSNDTENKTKLAN